MLHNFAGNIEMYGILDSIATGPIEARVSKNSAMVRQIRFLLFWFSFYTDNLVKIDSNGRAFHLILYL